MAVVIVSWAIVSAMGTTTDQLIQMAYQVSPTPNRRELDMLLTTGERISMSLMSMALSDLGVPVIGSPAARPA
jgi:aspartate kinase